MQAAKDRKQATQLHITFPAITIEDSYAISTEVMRTHRARQAGWRLAAGADLKTVSEMLGRSTIVITAGTYTSVLPEHARTTAESTLGTG